MAVITCEVGVVSLDTRFECVFRHDKYFATVTHDAYWYRGDPLQLLE